MIRDLMEKLGFSSREILVYLTLVQKGHLTANQLALSCKLNRTTTYGILAGLIKKNLVTEDLGSPTSVYLPAPASSLVELFTKKEAESRKQKELAIRTATEIANLAKNQPFQFAKITYVDEAGIESHLKHHTPKWCQSILAYDGVWRGFQDSRVLVDFPDYYKWLYSEGLSAGVTQELISEDQPWEVEFEKHNHIARRKIKIWQHGYDFTYSTWVMGDYVIMLQAKDHPFYLIEMKDRALARNLRDLFTGMWKFIPESSI